MNYETKTDVFEDVVDTLHIMDGAPDDYCKELLKRYSTALPDSTPVIPKEVGEYIKDSENLDLLVALTNASKGYKHSDLWITTHQNVFSSAWLDGVWRVKETGEIVKLEEEK